MFRLVWYLQLRVRYAVRSICGISQRNHFGYCAMITTMHDLHIALPSHHTRYPSHPALVYPLTGQGLHAVDHLPMELRDRSSHRLLKTFNSMEILLQSMAKTLEPRKPSLLSSVEMSEPQKPWVD